MTGTSYTEVPLGAILPGRRQFLAQVAVTSETQPLLIELPGQLVKCGTQLDYAIKPWGRVVSSAAGYSRAAVVSAGVLDETGLDAQIATFNARIAAAAPSAFSIRLASKLTFGAALDALEQSSGGCGCGGGPGRVSIPGTISVGLGWSATEEVWSQPVAARLYLSFSYGPEDGVFAFHCHSIWFGWTDRSTACEGDCPEESVFKDCMCNDTKRRFNCAGWTTCWCHETKAH